MAKKSPAKAKTSPAKAKAKTSPAKKSPAKKAPTPRRGRSSAKVKSAALVDSDDEDTLTTSENIDNQQLSVSPQRKKGPALKTKSKRKRESPSDTEADADEDSDDSALPSVSPKKKIRFYSESESPTKSDEDFLATSDSEGDSDRRSDGISEADSTASAIKPKGKRRLTEDNKARRTPKGRTSVTKSRKGKGKVVDSSDHESKNKRSKSKKRTSSDEEQSISWSESDDVFTSKQEGGMGSGNLNGAVIMGSTPESQPSPETCEVMNDPNVIADKDKGVKYSDLPNLRSKQLYIFGLESRDGNILFSQWSTYIPKANLTMAKRFMVFSDSGMYINPSRVDPAKLFVRHAYATAKNRNLTNGIGSQFLCLTPVMCVSSSLLTPRSAPTKTGNKPRVYKFIAGVLHTVEYERFAAAMGMAWGVPGMSAPMTNNAMSFSTRSETEESVTTSYLSSVTAPGMFSPRKSSSSTSAGVFNKIRSSLGAHENVPVYDGRTKVFNVDSKSLDKIDTLPKFVGEVPTGSLIVVAYTAGAYEGNNSVQTLSLNVNWVLLLGSKE